MEKLNLNDYSLASFLLEALFKRYYEGSILYRMCDFELKKEKNAYELKVNGEAGVHTPNLSMNYSSEYGRIKGTVSNNIGTQSEKTQTFDLYVIGSNSNSNIWIMFVDDKLYNFIDIPEYGSLTDGIPYGTKIMDAENQLKLRSQCQMFLVPRDFPKNDITYKTQDGKETFTLSRDKKNKKDGSGK